MKRFRNLLILVAAMIGTTIGVAAPLSFNAGSAPATTGGVDQCPTGSTIALAPQSSSTVNWSCSTPTTTTTTRPPATTTTTQPPSTTTTTAPPTTTTTLPPSGSRAMLGLYNNGDSAKTLGLSNVQVDADYAYGNGSTTYAASGAQAAKGETLLLRVGVLTTAQAQAIAQILVANGQASAWIDPMWEMNQHGWFGNWNESTLTAAQYKADFITDVNGFRSVAGSSFKFVYNLTSGGAPGVAGQSNNAAGRSNFDSFPGTAYVNYIGIDVYDNNGSVAAAQQNITYDATQAQSYGLQWIIPEWGAYSTDDPAFVNQIYADSNLPSCAEESLFSASFYSKGSAGASLTDFPNMLAAYKTDFDSE